MTEEEAAAKLCALMNEIEQAGHQVGSYANNDRSSVIYVGKRFELTPPRFEDGDWKVAEEK